MVADLVPAVGVAWFGWDVHAALFVLSCEVLILAAALGWLFDYPRRSTLRGILMVILLLPMGLLTWVMLAKIRGTVPESVVGTVAALAPVTWPALASLGVHGVTATRRAMARAREQGASIQVNDQILLHWLAGVAGPFVVFVAVAVAGRSLGAGGLAAILVTKALADLWFQERAFRQGSRPSSSA